MTQGASPEGVNRTVGTAGTDSLDLSKATGPIVERDKPDSNNPKRSTDVHTDLHTDELVEARTLAGFRDLVPGTAMIKETMLQRLRQVFESYGFLPIETPHLEHADILVGKGGSEINKQIYHFTHGEPGGRQYDVALRFDLTVPLARFVVQHRDEISIPFRRYAIGNVFRGEKPQAGRFREFTQCDFDVIGTDSVSSDAEIVQVMGSSMLALGIKDFTIGLNNRKILNGIVEHIGATDKTVDILRIVDKLDKIGVEGARTALLDPNDVGITQSQATALLDFVFLTSDTRGAALIAKLSKYKNLNAQFDLGIQEIQQVESILSVIPFLENRYKFDFTIARGLGYYTGTVFETVLDNLPKIGSVCSGGRFDNLTKSFSLDHLPGVGASVGLDRLIVALQELKLVNELSTCAMIMLTQMGEDVSPEVHRWAALLRQRGLNVEVFPDPGKVKAQFKYASRRGFPWVMTIGPDEKARGVAQLKNMQTQQQREVTSVDDALELMSQR